jgi:hypothetical protein
MKSRTQLLSRSLRRRDQGLGFFVIVNERIGSFAREIAT